MGKLKMLPVGLLCYKLNMNRPTLILLITCLLGFSCWVSCKKWNRRYDFPQIQQEDTLRVLTLNTSTSYFLYRDQPMGYHYEMVSGFCRQHGVVPQIIVAENVNTMVEMLEEGIGDLIAYNMPVTNMTKESFLTTGFKQVSHQVLVQRIKVVDSMLTDVTGLIGKKITVLENSKYHERLVNLNKELGGGIIIDAQAVDTLVEEDLIRMVSRGDISYTVAEDNLAKFNQTYFRNLDVHLPISFDQLSSWMVRKKSPILADSLNSWFQRNSSEPAYLRIAKRYFEEAKGYGGASLPRVSTILAPGVISPYDAYFKRYGSERGIDWRLLASIAYQESTFDNEGSSWAGAKGLMGLMPSTAASMGADSEQLFDPETNIGAGSAYLKYLIGYFRSIKNPDERLKMALAAYNGGIGHILDARALAEKYGADKDIWNGNVERFVLLKRLEEYYMDPVCRSGYFRGDETVDYVSDVIRRWEFYKQKVKE